MMDLSTHVRFNSTTTFPAELPLVRHGLDLCERRSAGRYGARAVLRVGVGRPLTDEHGVGH